MIELPEASDPFSLITDHVDLTLFSKKEKNSKMHQPLYKFYDSSYLSAYIQIYITIWCNKEEELVHQNSQVLPTPQ
ncbi:MAG: hypothetical protein K0R80_2963 [Clostridia bacterium]|jgi:hypothetical protein|nr:hypothetical protein [Clostridia bacterium]